MTPYIQGKEKENFNFVGRLSSVELVEGTTVKIKFSDSKEVYFDARVSLTDVMTTKPGKRFAVNGKVDAGKMIAWKITPQ